MNRTVTNFTRLALLLTAISAALIGAAAEKPPQQPTKLEKPQKGMGRYAVLLWEAGTPIPGNNGKHMGKITEPDFAKLGGTVLVTNGNRRLVDLPVKEAEKLKKHNAVASMQRLWMGEPLEELETPAGSSARRFELETDVDTNLDWGPKAYQYDSSGNIRQIGTDSFSYDTAGRLIQSNIGGKVETFKYDAFGNLIEKTVTGANPVTIPVDGESNRIIGGVYDAKGNVLAGNGRKFTYDPLNMLMEDTGNGGRQMVYDADDERIGVIIGTGLSRWWIRDFEGKVIREYQGVGGSEFAWYWEQDWIYGAGQLVGGDRVPFWWQNEEDGRTYTFGGKRHYHLDHLGSVRMVTDSSGRSVSEHDYYAFGVTPTKAYQEQINWGDPHIDAMRFAGHQREFLGFINTENTDYLDYMHARYYDPNLGRFLSVDPIFNAKRALKQPQMWNRYAYALNNPLRFIDPTGMLTYQATVLGVEVRVHIDDELSEEAQLALKARIDASLATINAGKEELTKQEQGIVTLIKSLEVGRADSGINTQTGQFSMYAMHLMLQSSDAFAADYVHDSKHAFNANPLNPLYTDWFVGGRRQNIQELDERDASEFAVRVGAKIGLEPKALWKYQEVLIDSICNHQWWRSH